MKRYVDNIKKKLTIFINFSILYKNSCVKGLSEILEFISV